MPHLVGLLGAERLGGDLLLDGLGALALLLLDVVLDPDSIALIFLSPFIGPLFGPFFSPFFGPFFETAYCNLTQSKKFMHMFLSN